MSFVKLRDIGKIYVSGTHVTVGIRGVNLSFEKGEFVAVTGQSGSGKSTLLNVISGNDTYEEGELYIQGEPTSHYLQGDWEEYRKQYISFIFQDYNIIESFTVLQNVELALMHIESKRERRKRALDLIEKVGLKRHVRHKGSKLSGGQKQRTVIARALAKDSPIILADEPTGNLDSQTSKEILELMREIAKEKLLIVVTHNFEQVEEYATRHIRVFDGAVEFDQKLKPFVIPEESNSEPAAKEKEKNGERKKVRNNSFKNGLELGSVRFRAMPKLSMFMCLLMIISSLGVFFITGFSGDAAGLFEKNTMFTPIEGRVVIVKLNGGVISDDELDTLVKDTGALSYLHYDYLLDSPVSIWDENEYSTYEFVYGESYGVDVGTEPSAPNEVLLYLPISYQPIYGENYLMKNELPNIFGTKVDYKVVGVKYYYDNNLPPKIVLTKEGFEVANAISYFSSRSMEADFRVEVSFKDQHNSSYQKTISGKDIMISFDMTKESYKVQDSDYITKRQNATTDYKIYLTATRNNYDYGGGYGYVIVGDSYYGNGGYGQTETFVKDFSDATEVVAELLPGSTETTITLSYDLFGKLVGEYFQSSYQQASLFYDSFDVAERKLEVLREKGYTAVVANTVSQLDPLETILATVALVGMAVLWIICMLFLAMFMSVTSMRSIMATKGDLAVMRSMGISVKSIKVSMYVQMLITLIPAYAIVGIAAWIVYTNPVTNGKLRYLYDWQYFMIAIGMLLITLLVTKKQSHKIFDQSVKKTLGGGNAE